MNSNTEQMLKLAIESMDQNYSALRKELEDKWVIERIMNCKNALEADLAMIRTLCLRACEEK